LYSYKGKAKFLPLNQQIQNFSMIAPLAAEARGASDIKDSIVANSAAGRKLAAACKMVRVGIVS
jgi:acetylornithine deacetylase/succinyl-diaminopimelate desuccinylase-like protein